MSWHRGFGIFVSYRREDSRQAAGRLYDRLAQRFGADRVFIDVSGIDPGTDFARAIENAIRSCSVLLALIGEHWLTSLDRAGRPRLEDPLDYVRLEIESALAGQTNVVPVLVDGATMPGEDSLPDSLRPLARRQALSLRYENFDGDIARIVTTIGQVGPKAWVLEKSNDSIFGGLELVLSSGDERHSIVLKSGWLPFSAYKILVDGKVAVENLKQGNEYSLSALGSELGATVILTVDWKFHLEARSSSPQAIHIRIDNQMVSYRWGN